MGQIEVCGGEESTERGDAIKENEEQKQETSQEMGQKMSAKSAKMTAKRKIGWS